MRYVRHRFSIASVCLAVAPILVLLRLHLFLGRSPRAFAVVGQGWLGRQTQKKKELSFQTPAFDGTKLSRNGKSMLKKIQAAEGWWQVAVLLRQYNGTEIQVFNAAMYKALRLGKHNEGAEVYERACSLNVSKQSATFTAAMTIQSRLGNADAVRLIWGEAMSTCGLDAIIASARIRAAAEEGDVIGAATVLDDMKRSGVDVDIGHVTSAIRACGAAGGQNHNAAKYFFYSVLPEFKLQPNIITMNCFVAALRGAPLGDILAAGEAMTGWNIKPDRVFIDTLLATVLRKRPQERWSSAKQVADHVRRQEESRIAAARDALQEYKAQGIRLSRFAVLVDDGLRLLGEKRFAL